MLLPDTIYARLDGKACYHGVVVFYNICMCINHVKRSKHGILITFEAFPESCSGIGGQ
jgi:hypothetical protein